MNGAKSPVPVSTWFERGIDVLFAAVLVLSVSRDVKLPVLVVAGVLAVVYAFRLLVPGRASLSVWLVVLVVGWAGAVLFVSVDLVWVAVPLFFLELQILPLATGLAAVAATTATVIVAEALDDGLTTAEVAGPLMGAAFALVAGVSYRRVALEHELTRAALEALQVAQAELARSEHERGVLDERRRVAREVHDTIAQDLASILLLARSPLTSESSARIEQLASTSLGEARRIVDALGPVTLESTTLPTAVAQLAGGAAGGAPEVRVEVTGEYRPLPQPHETMLLRVAQGALANSREHANASTVFITLSYLDGEVAIDVVDDGIGFDPDVPDASHPNGHFGLAVMRQRIQQVGGAASIESAPGLGTAIHATVPAP